MKRTTAAAASLLIVAACTDPTASRNPNLTAAAMTAAFSTVPVGFSELTTSYAGDAGGPGSLFLPGPSMHAFGGGALMGGGLGEAFIGGMAFGPGPAFGHHGPFGGPLGGRAFTCTGSFANGRVTCDPVTHDGLTIARSFAYTNAAGQAQQAFDTSTTNSVNVQTLVTGTTSFTRDTTRDHHRGHGFGGPIIGDTTTILTANTTIRHSSDQTVTGLAQGSTKRTVNATSAGSESTTGTSSRGNFTSTRAAGDTTRGLSIPVQSGTTPVYPTAGTVIREMKATVTYAGSAAVTSTRREVVTYDGTATAKVTITTNGTTQNCTLPLPRGRLSCS
jgi:hypothetical protein